MRRELLVVGLVSLSVVLVLAWPALGGGTQVGPSMNDHSSLVYTLWWVAERVGAGELPWGRAAGLESPDGAVLFPANLPGALAMTPVVWLLGPWAAFNTLALGHHVLTALFAWAWARRDGLSRPGAAVVTVALSLAPAMTTATFNGNPDVTPWFWWPLALYARHTHWGLAAALAVLAGLANPYVGVMTTLCLLAFQLRNGERGALWRTAVVVALGAGAIGALQTAALHDPGAAILKGPRTSLVGTASLLELLRPAPVVLRTDAVWELPRVAVGAYLGWSLLLAALWRGRDRVLWALVLIAVLMALGPVLRLGVLELGPPTPGVPQPVPNTGVALPWDLIERLPGLGQLQLTARFTGLAVLALAWLVAERLPELPRSWALAALVTLDLGVAGAGLQALTTQPRFDDGSCAALAPLEDGPVLDLPGTRHELWLGLATCHGRPVAEGINRPFSRRLQDALRQARSPADLPRLLASAGHRWLVYHRTVPAGSGPQEAVPQLGCATVEAQAFTIVDLDCVRASASTR